MRAGSMLAEHAARSRVVSKGGSPRFLDEQTRLEARMLKTLMMSAAVSALMVSGALAQDKPPMASPPAKAEGAAMDSAKFIQAQGTDQWVFSTIEGTDVLGTDNEHIVTARDTLFDTNGT